MIASSRFFYSPSHGQGELVRATLRALIGWAMLASEVRADVDPLAEVERRRIEVIQRVAPSVVCLFDAQQRGGGSGVLIDVEGYGLTNYHVAAEMLDTRRGLGGLSDGKLYDLEILGIDPTGDVAMFRMIGDQPFPFATLGDSDRVQVGDAAIAMGNPFTISEDYTPTVTTGLVTGVHRYQAGQGKNLIYSDCIQVDAAINPGNSGGPLFNADGEIIGINGRISVNRRGRLNVGFGYAISSNQVKRFMPALRAGLLANHGTLQATVASEGGGVVFDRLTRESALVNSGVKAGDKLLSIDGIALTSGNQYLGLLGAYPADWPVRLTVEREGQRREIVIRLEAVTSKSQKPFQPSREANQREVERVLRRFQKATLREGMMRRPTGWKWKIERQMPGSNEWYEASQVGDGPLRVQRLRADRSVASSLTATDSTVTEKIGDVDELQPPLDVKLTLAATFIMHRWLLENVETMDLSAVQHAGGDFLDAKSGTGCVLEVLEWSVVDGGRARFEFDSETGHLLRVRLRDIPTGQEILMDLSSSRRDIGGIEWPEGIEVTAGDRQYVDRLSDWELSP
jgi:S1-C subfamily serine protease